MGRRAATMLCPYCGVKQTDVLRTVYRRHKTYRYRRCHFCKARFRTQEKPVRWEGVDRKWPGTHRHVDHIVPARLIRRLRAGNPDRRENLQCICGTCHGYKLQADHKLCMGDRLGYLEILRTHNFDLARVERALALYDL